MRDSRLTLMVAVCLGAVGSSGVSRKTRKMQNVSGPFGTRRIEVTNKPLNG